MKILLTGGAGFIGSHVADAYINQGHEVVIVDNLSTGRRENLNPQARFYEVDIRDFEALEGIFQKERPEVVNHHAAQASVVISTEDPAEDARTNILGTLHLIELARRHGVRLFIYVSSGGAVYGEPRYLPCDEKHPVNPLSPYGVSKHAPEHYLYLYGLNYGLEYVILRYGNVYGPRQDPYGEAGVVAIFSERMLRDEPVYIYGDGEQHRDFVYVGDVVDFNLRVLDPSGLGSLQDPLGRVYNVGTGVGTTVNRIAAELASLTGYRRKPIYTDPRPGEVYRIHLDITKARRELGWEPRVPLREGLARTVEYYREELGRAKRSQRSR